MYCRYNIVVGFILKLYQRKQLGFSMRTINKYYAVTEENFTQNKRYGGKLTYVVDLPDLGMMFHKVSLDEQATGFINNSVKKIDFF